MGLADNGGGGLSAADIAAVLGNNGGGNNGNNNDNGFSNNQSTWLILILVLFAAMSGGFGGNRGGYSDGGASFIPYMVASNATSSNDIQRGFDQQATQGAIGALQTQVGNGFADAAVAQCQGNANITAAITNGQYATAQAITGAKDTINGTLNQNQLATYQGLNQLAMSLQQCLKKGIQAVKNIFNFEGNFTVGTCAA